MTVWVTLPRNALPTGERRRAPDDHEVGTDALDEAQQRPRDLVRDPQPVGLLTICVHRVDDVQYCHIGAAVRRLLNRLLDHDRCDRRCLMSKGDRHAW